MSIINTTVPAFKAQAFHNGKFVEVTSESIKGKWAVFIFMPAAFTFNCPTEVEDAADNYAEFQKLETEVFIVTTDTHFSHKVGRPGRSSDRAGARFAEGPRRHLPARHVHRVHPMTPPAR